MSSARDRPRPLHILVLADRDWTHPQGGGSGANIYAQVARWVAWGHRVTLIAGTYPGAKPYERLAENLEVHRMGSRSTVFPKAIRKVLRGLGRDADVVLEVINGIPFFTPLWLRKPCVALVHHVHRELYVEEFGLLGRILSWLLESLPFRFLYRRIPFLTISDAARRDLEREGVPPEHIHVSYLGVEPGAFGRGERAPEPQLVYLGRLKQYKRIEYILDVLESIPEARLDIVGEGDHRSALEAEIAQRGLVDRVVLHGHVDEQRKTELYGRAWVSLTASSSEGWSLTVMEAALCGTPSAALAVGGLPESIVDGETGVLAQDLSELKRRVGELIANPEQREAMADAAEARARRFTWARTAEANLGVLEAEVAAGQSAGVGLPSRFRPRVVRASRNGRADEHAGPWMSVVIPAYNEELAIVPTLSAVLEWLRGQHETWEVVVVDNASTDRTIELVTPFLDGERVRLLRNPENRGKGFSVRRGMLETTGRYRLLCDADCARSLASVPRMLEAMDDGADVVIGSRNVEGADVDRTQPIRRRIAGWNFLALCRIVLHEPSRDIFCGFKLWRGEAADVAFSMQSLEGWTFDVEVLALARRFGFRVREVGIVWSDREGSRLSMLRVLVPVVRELLSARANVRAQVIRAQAVALASGDRTASEPEPERLAGP